jgi:hypothetical protein
VKVGIILPWRGSKTRTAGFEASLERHKQIFPDANIYKSDSVGLRFNPSEARNRGCLEAIADGCEVLVVLDADTLFMSSSIEEAVKIATTKGIVCYAYTIATELGIDETKGYLAGTFNPFGIEGLGAGHPIPDHVGSGWVLTPDMDISDQEQKVQDIANAAWTPEVVAAYNSFNEEKLQQTSSAQ